MLGEVGCAEMAKAALLSRNGSCVLSRTSLSGTICTIAVGRTLSGGARERVCSMEFVGSIKVFFWHEGSRARGELYLWLGVHRLS